MKTNLTLIIHYFCEQLEHLFVKTAIYEIIKEETIYVMIQRTIGSLCIGFSNQWFLFTLCPDGQGLNTLCQVAFSRFSGKVKLRTTKIRPFRGRCG